MEVTRIDRADYSTSATPETEQLTEQRRVAAAVHQINNDGIFGAANELTFGRDPTTRKMVIRIVDRDTREVVQELPPEYILRMTAGGQFG